MFYVDYNLCGMIPRRGYPCNQRNYQSAHRKVNELERKYFPRTYHACNAWIARNVPVGFLAATHTPNGTKYIWEAVPIIYREQISAHEGWEHEIMEGTYNNPRKISMFPNMNNFRLF